jgi:hypothetical protein
MSTDNSYEIAKNEIGDDERFILIKNNSKKYKTKNFIDVIRDNPKINWDDVIIEIDGDDKLLDFHVLGLINKIFTDDNVWISGSKWQDVNGNLGNYGKPKPERARLTSWNFSHMRCYRAFLFRSIKDEDLKYNGEYHKAGCDLGFGIPMLEMSGSEHFVYIDKPLYEYHWHDNQSYSNSNSFGNKNLQGEIAKHIYSLPRYKQLVFIDYNPKINEDVNKKTTQLVKTPFTPKKYVPLKKEPVIKEKVVIPKKEIDYNLINQRIKINRLTTPIVISNDSNVFQILELKNKKRNGGNNRN